MKEDFQLKDSGDHLIVKNAPRSLLFERVFCSEHVTEFGLSLSPRFSAAGMVRLKNHEKSGWVHLI